MKSILCMWFLLFINGIAFAGSSPFAGTYQGEDVVLEIEESSDGQFTGTFVISEESVPFTAREQNGSLTGTLSIYDETIPFRLTLSGSTLTFSADGESQVLTRQSQSPAGSGAVESSRTPEDSDSILRINGAALGNMELRGIEQSLGMRIPKGDYWYDKISGAWGIAGGPTLGFTQAGLDLGGPLKADASRGNTGVFINGRQLPMQDVLGLQSLGVPVVQGRWWVDHQGNFGIEGNTIPLGNLFQYSRGKGGSYQRATAGGYIGGDGTTSYFFDPKTGSSVMTGP